MGKPEAGFLSLELAAPALAVLVGRWDFRPVRLAPGRRSRWMKGTVPESSVLAQVPGAVWPDGLVFHGPGTQTDGGEDRGPP